ncbi:hypothetical protein VNO77_14636 [Canavalia gladiata]|uniref:Uncharacterized protein n=1 Tax=Canavalia gladiata TaxID=3824 RepID=A0AAN9LYB7_CANGL
MQFYTQASVGACFRRLEFATKGNNKKQAKAHEENPAGSSGYDETSSTIDLVRARYTSPHRVDRRNSVSCDQFTASLASVLRHAQEHSFISYPSTYLVHMGKSWLPYAARVANESLHQVVAES